MTNNPDKTNTDALACRLRQIADKPALAPSEYHSGSASRDRAPRQSTFKPAAITLDGGGATRLFHFDGGDFRKTTTTVTLQHLAIKGAKSSGTTIPDAPPPCSQGTDVDGGGAAILIRDGVLHVIDVVFEGGQAAALGPDVAGGGVYGIGSIDVTIVGSRFTGNKAANGGDVGSLFSNLTLVNNTFDQNAAQGEGMMASTNLMYSDVSGGFREAPAPQRRTGFLIRGRRSCGELSKLYSE